MVGKYIPLATKEYQIAAQACDMFWLKGQANFQTMPVANHGLFKQRIKYKTHHVKFYCESSNCSLLFGSFRNWPCNSWKPVDNVNLNKNHIEYKLFQSP